MLKNPLWQTGRGNLDKLALSTTAGASAEIYRYGAHLTSWKTTRGREWMFLSDQAVFQEGEAIRGGVPVIFPQFSGFGSGQRHGFARNMKWRLLREPHQHDSASRCVFALDADESTLTFWPHRFHAEFAPVLTDQQLIMTLTVRNTDDKPFTFTAALHTYFAIRDIHKVQLKGLEGLRYWDNNGSDFQKDRFTQKENALNFPGAIDRVYFDCQKSLELIDGDDRLHIQATGFEEVVVWNPGAEATKKLNDMVDEEYRLMLCVEAAVIDQPVTLAPGQEWNGAQILRHE